MGKESAPALAGFLGFAVSRIYSCIQEKQALARKGPGLNVLQLTEAAFLKPLHFATDLGTRIF